jgi:hypothetical protein
MHRPINWVVVCISLVFLLTFAGREPESVVRTVHIPVLAETLPSVGLAGTTSVPEFGYVRADGSFLPLAQKSNLKPAEPRSLTSASTSWQ